MPGGSSAEPLKAEAFPSATIGVRGMSEDTGPEIDWDSLTFSFTETLVFNVPVVPAFLAGPAHFHFVQTKSN